MPKEFSDGKTVKWTPVKAKAVKAVKKPFAVKKTAKRIRTVEENKTKYDKRIKQLKVITEDRNYIPGESTNKYHEFIRSMYGALLSGRKITPKMESSITNIVIAYTKYLKELKDPELKKKREKFIEDSLYKVSLITKLLIDAEYSSSYQANSKWFLNSISEQVKKRGSLSLKQKKALNKMYKQFKKRYDKLTKN